MHDLAPGARDRCMRLTSRHPGLQWHALPRKARAGRGTLASGMAHARRSPHLSLSGDEGETINAPRHKTGHENIAHHPQSVPRCPHSSMMPALTDA
eukprot:5247277-Alexandrium_andersonii.AAC.1